MNTANNDAGAHTRKILFLTNSESGQTNTIFAMALEALTRPHVEVHIGSFPKLKRRVERLSPKLNFHAFDGEDLAQSVAAKGYTEDMLPHLPTRKSFAAYGWTLGQALAGWDGESYMRIYNGIAKLIEELNPATVVVDSLLNPGIDACYFLKRRFVLNSPNTPMDLARLQQPWLKGLWYYPAFGSGILFPVPWRDLPINTLANLTLIYKLAMSPEISELVKYRNARGLPGWLPVGTAPTRAPHIICPGVPELDFPLVMPKNLGLYGPIVLDTNTVEIVDPELNQWLNRGETVIMCMGTHFSYSESQAKAVIDGFLGAVDHGSNIQFLWKLRNKSRFENFINEALKNPRDKERVRIVNWFDADPTSIMNHPNVVAYIHHGGANSYYEAALAGLPQIILAQWLDLYDMAVRVEYRGIGIYGNKKVAPGIEAVEFGAAIARVVGPGKESEGFRERARAVGEVCRRAGGKRRAVDKLLEFAERGEDKE